jgi:NAD(P)H dehydrogenase (quinone)
MSRVLVLYYSTYGHIETMAEAVAEGARATGATVDVKRVPETVPEAIAGPAHFKLDQAAPVAVADLEHYDAIIVGCPTRFGRLPSQMASFFDQAGGLWARARSTARWAAPSRPPPPSTAARRSRCSR